MVSTFVAPSCIPLLLLGDVNERVGPMSEESVGVNGGAFAVATPRVELMLKVFPLSPAFAAGADVGRSMVAPIAEVMLVARSPVVSYLTVREHGEYGGMGAKFTFFPREEIAQPASAPAAPAALFTKSLGVAPVIWTCGIWSSAGAVSG